MGNVITFGRSSNTDLDATLKEMQRKILLPSYLPVKQRRKLFRTRWKLKLEQEPIEIEIDDQKIRLRHLDRAAGDVPSPRSLLWRALDDMQTKNDWQKLPKILEALYFNAQVPFHYTDWPKIIRRASRAGTLGPIFEAMRLPDRTGMRLDCHEKLQEVMTAIVWEAANAGWTSSATERAMRNADKVVAFLQQDDHQMGIQARAIWDDKGRFPLKRDPQVLATPLLLAAMLVAKHGKAAEYADTLHKYATLVLERWPEGKGLLELHQHEAYLDPEGMAYLMEKNKFLQVAAPVLRGFDLAIEASGSQEMAAQIKSRRDPMADEVRDALAADETKEKRGTVFYEKCFAEPSVSGRKKANKADAAAETEPEPVEPKAQAEVVAT